MNSSSCCSARTREMSLEATLPSSRRISPSRRSGCAIWIASAASSCSGVTEPLRTSSAPSAGHWFRGCRIASIAPLSARDSRLLRGPRTILLDEGRYSDLARPWNTGAMRAVVQRVTYAKVTVEGEVVGAIGNGLLVLLGVATDETAEEADRLAGKVARLRILESADGKLDLSVLDT